MSARDKPTAGIPVSTVGPPAIRRSWWSRGRRWLAVAVLAVMVVGATADRFVATGHDLNTVRHEIADSRARLARLGDEVGVAGTVRRDAQSAATHAVSVLDAERSRHGTASRSMQVAREQLTLVQRELAASLHNERQQGNQAVALQLCLDGVSQALNRISVGDVRGWQVTIAAVDPQCQSAERVA